MVLSKERSQVGSQGVDQVYKLFACIPLQNLDVFIKRSELQFTQPSNEAPVNHLSFGIRQTNGGMIRHQFTDIIKLIVGQRKFTLLHLHSNCSSMDSC